MKAMLYSMELHADYAGNCITLSHCDLEVLYGIRVQICQTSYCLNFWDGMT